MQHFPLPETSKRAYMKKTRRQADLLLWLMPWSGLALKPASRACSSSARWASSAEAFLVGVAPCADFSLICEMVGLLRLTS